MSNILQYHDPLFERLLFHKSRISELRFRTRKTNRSNRLANGYWFLGDDRYLAIGFWEGVNWQTRVPNIAFMVNESGQSWIDVNMKDSDEKAEFNRKYLIDQLRLDHNGGDWYEKEIPIETPTDALDFFIKEYWGKIDDVIRKHSQELDHIRLGLSIIKDEDFERNLKKISNYRNVMRIRNEKLAIVKPERIKDFAISNYGPIGHCSIESIPSNTQWVFFTGENGTGKTSILRALATALGHYYYEDEDNQLNIRMSFFGDSEKEIEIVRESNNETNKRKPITKGLAAYGPVRLLTRTRDKKQLQKNQLGKNSYCSTLFDNEGRLLSVERAFEDWSDDKFVDIEDRKESIRELYVRCLLTVVDVDIQLDGIAPRIDFYESDKENGSHDPVSFDRLSSGILSIANMMGDLAITLFHQQPRVNDTGHLKGVVIIDEIDIHLHPKFQRHFVEQLTEAFPNVQFIVSTHSPIPLLGAPDNSVFVRVERDSSNGVTTELMKVEVKNLMPNSILTSPLFDLGSITSKAQKDHDKIRTEDRWREVQFNDKVQERLQSIYQKLKQDEKD